MSTPRPRSLDLTPLPGASLQPGRAVAAIEKTSLRYELSETIRRLLQHMILALLLAIRLYMLPLLYISYKLSAHDDPWYPALWNLVLRPGRTLADCSGCRQGNSSVEVGRAWTSVRDGLFTPVRIFKSLYSLGKISGEDPNALQPDPFPQHDPTTTGGIDGRTKDVGGVEDQGAESTDSSLQAPASASQMYHAALLNGSTLDEILAAFEADGDSRAVGFDRVVIRHGPKACLSAEQLDAMGQRKRQWYRTPSVRSTPEALLGTGKADESFPSRAVRTSLRDFQQPTTSYRQAHACRVRLQAELQADNRLPKNDPKSPPHTRIHRLPETQQSDMNSSPLDRCPTFVRRHAPSRLPRRSVTGEKQAFAMLKERGAMSTPVIPISPPTPTKRVRLQRRVRPKKNMVKASND